jgi:hypothetical protein
MPLGKLVRCLPGVIAILLLPAAAALSQTTANSPSIGFADPADIRGLLAYRLPDWGYRTWELGFGLNGSGTDQTAGETRQVSNSFATNLDTDFRLYRENEQRIQSLDLSAGGDYQRSHNGTALNESSGHTLGGRLAAGGFRDQYLNDGPFLVGAAANVGQSYSERILDRTANGETVADRSFGRRGSYNVTARVGWGRVRDVTPLIRAQRLSERLTALGHPRLTRAQVQEVAEVLAREQGYRTVLDRPERSFWDDVLAPMLDPDRPLSTYEIFYLRDVMSEDIGPRREGTSLTASYGYGHRRDDNEVVVRIDDRGPFLGITWVRNPTLNHQLAVGLVGSYRTVNYTRDYPEREDVSTREDYLRGEFSIQHLWTVADRYRLDTSLGFSGRYSEAERDDLRSIRRDLETRLGSSFRMFVEDNLSLVASLQGSNAQIDAETTGGSQPDIEGEQYRRAWRWSYRVGLEYYLDRFLY